jgi:cofilin
VYDHHFTNSEGTSVFNKMVFVLWSPDHCSVRNKMLYAAAKDAIKKSMDGLTADIQVSICTRF